MNIFPINQPKQTPVTLPLFAKICCLRRPVLMTGVVGDLSPALVIVQHPTNLESN
jgi:hypothetical protein